VEQLADLLPLGLDELLTTTRSVRKRLDLERPVPREVIEECIEIATQAPTGSNRQTWHFVAVVDPAKKQALADLYGRAFDPYAGTSVNPFPEDDIRTLHADAVRGSATYLREHFHEVPVMVIPCSEGRVPPGSPDFAHAGYWGSLLPAVWSFMLALRARGLGSAWTTLHLVYEKEAAEVLGIPYERVSQGGLFPVAWTKGTDFKKAARLPVDRVLHWDSW
jgi:nitroreductase